MGLLRKKSVNSIELIQTFLSMLDAGGLDEMSVSASALDAIREKFGERPCCLWTHKSDHFGKLCERGVIDVFFGQNGQQPPFPPPDLSNKNHLFEITAGGPTDSVLPFDFEGLLHVPLKSKDKCVGILSLAVTKKEAGDEAFTQALECLTKIMAHCIGQGQDQYETRHREHRLRAEVESTMRELAQTNKRLIERVKELKSLYKELHKRVQELTKANRAKDEFLSIVSHELRTPLTSLTGFLAVLLDEEAGALNDQQRKFLQITKQSANRLNLIISDLLDISRIEAGRLHMEMEHCSIHDIVARSVEDLKSSAMTKKIELQSSSSPEIPEVWGDPSRLQQVIDNLISNAIKFTEPGGKIDVLTQDMGEFIKVAVRDTGKGLSEEEQSRVFDMFYQADASTRRPAGGAGLGLAIARGIVTMHGGQISVLSEKGKGSVFSFHIPKKKARKAA